VGIESGNKKGGLISQSLKGHLTSEADGQPNFKGRMMVNPSSIGPVVFLGVKVGRSLMVVKEQFPFRPAVSTPEI
jgi:hypothetical protein